MVQFDNLSARVVRRVDLTGDLFKLWLLPSAPFRFKAGQYCGIGVDGVFRAYSIVSAPHEPELELFVELLPPPLGVLTPRLHQLQVGDEVALRPRAKGLFVFKPNFREHLMISTVTGVVPYVAMLRHLIHSDAEAFGQYKFHILQGASYQTDFAYDAELQQLAEKFDNLKYVPTVSRPAESANAGWSGATGRVNALVADYVARKKVKLADTLVYACGHPAMVDTMREWSATAGVEFSEERFWKE